MAARRVVPLIQCDEATGEYTACEDTLEWIKAHTRPFGVITCAGKYRTGKSFLMNRLAECNATNGFGVGDTVQACTKGLWVCRHFFRISDELDVLFVDTEGIDALDASDDNDVRIFTLALLLSSVFVYNSVGHIDEAALSTLSLMTRVTESIRQSHQVGEDAMSCSEMASHMPAFHWILRDFSLRMEDKAGNPLEPDQYLEDSIDVGSHSGDDTRTATRAAIRDCFKVRHLHTLPRPAGEADMQKLDARPWIISAAFHEAIETLRIGLFASVKPMGRDDVPMTGNMYAEMCRFMCKHGKSELPVMRDTWSLMASVHARDLKDELVSTFIETINAWGPTEKTILIANAQNEMNDMMVAFQKRSMQPIDLQVKQALEQAMQQASTQRISIIGLDYEQLTSQELETVHNKVCAPDVSAVDALQTIFSSYTEFKYEKHIWIRCAEDRFMMQWIPTIRDAIEREVEGVKQGVNHELTSARLNAESIEASLRDTIKAHECKIEELAANVDATMMDLTKEKDTCEEMRQSVVSLRLQNARLTTEMQKERAKREEDADPSTGVCTRCAHVDDLIESTTAERANVEAKLDELTSEHAATQKKLVETEEALKTSMAREAQLTKSWTDGLAKLKEEALVTKKKDDATIQQLQAKVDGLNNETQLMTKESERRDREDARLKEEHEREIRQMSELLERSRQTSQQSQDRVVDMHKSMLADLQQRDERLRTLQATYTTEQIEYQTKYTDSVRQCELKDVENNNLKRRIDDMQRYEEECKRLRVERQDSTTKIVRVESELQTLQRRYDAVAAEREDTRKRLLAAENENALLRAEKQLLNAHKDMGLS